MSRYIDVDVLVRSIKEHLTKVAGVDGDSCESDSPVIAGYLLAKDHVIDLIAVEPTTDVVPKNEVDELQSMLDATIAGQETLQKALADAKTEVAREIFENIDTMIFGTIIPNDCAIISIAKLAELKKKYTGGKT